MKSHFFLVIVLVIIGVFSSCLKDDIPVLPPATSGHPIDTTKPYVIANEFVATGSSVINEFGLATDWIELYNPTKYPLDFNKDSIYVTDRPMSDTIASNDKYRLKGFVMSPHSYLVIFCDDSDIVKTQIHTSFGLSKSGEFVGVYKKNSNGTYTAYTEHAFNAQTAGKSEGQIPDNSGVWDFLTPTPNSSNRK